MSPSSDSAIPLVDLVIAIDTSVSMKDEAAELSKAAEAAIEATRASCPSNLRVMWLGVEGTWTNTNFNRTIRDYLTKECHVAETDLRGRRRGTVKGGGAQEDGARAIEDISAHFDWRPDTLRAMFYLSDEGLEGGGNDVTEADIEAANRAIAGAKAANTRVYTYFGTSRSRNKAKLEQEFARVAQETGGRKFNNEDSIDGFTQVLEKVICGTRNQEAIETVTVTAGTASAASAASTAASASAAASGSTTSETEASGVGTPAPAAPETAASGSATSGSGTSGSATSGSGTSGSATSGSATSGSGTSGSATSEPATSESGTSTMATSESGTSGSATSEPATSESGTSATATSESGTSEAATPEPAAAGATHHIIRNHSLVAAGIGLAPLPLIDVAAVGVVQLVMVSKLSKVYGIPFFKHLAKAFIVALLGAGQAGLILTSVGRLIPGIGVAGFTLTASLTAGAVTYAIGKVFVRHFEMGGTFLNLDANAMRDYFAEQCREGKLVMSRSASDQ